MQMFPAKKAQQRNRRTMLACLAIVGGMVGLSFASVPLYRLFCQVTGYGGTTQVAEEKSKVTTDRVMRIRFDATIHPNVAWKVRPAQREVTLKVGENAVAFYRAENTTDETVHTVATFNVTPLKIGQYFNKIECFCFTEQSLKPGQAVDMPVSFFVDPAINDDPNAQEVKTITLSYTFFPAEAPEDKEKLAAEKSETGRKVVN